MPERTMRGNSPKQVRTIVDESVKRARSRMGKAEPWVSTITEAAFQRQIQELAALLGFSHQYHVKWSMQSAAGFPDLVLLAPTKGRTVFLEVKGPKGKLSPKQADWLEALRQAGNEAAAVWPKDWPLLYPSMDC